MLCSGRIPQEGRSEESFSPAHAHVPMIPLQEFEVSSRASFAIFMLYVLSLSFDFVVMKGIIL